MAEKIVENEQRLELVVFFEQSKFLCKLEAFMYLFILEEVFWLFLVVIIRIFI